MEAEWLAKNHNKLDTPKWKYIIVVENVPQQDNDTDCGVFCCMYAEFSSISSKFTFSQADMAYFRQKMALELYTGEMINKLLVLTSMMMWKMTTL